MGAHDLQIILPAPRVNFIQQWGMNAGVGKAQSSGNTHIPATGSFGAPHGYCLAPQSKPPAAA